MADYISQFTGSEIDQRLAKVPQVEAALAGKQATLVSGTNIKTINGQSVLGSGDMTIQAGDTDAVKYVAQTLTDAQKAQARANIDAASLADIADFDFVTVTSLPTASASTMGHIYLVGPDANDNYDRYYTQQSGSTYSWVALGSTEIDLSGYATQAELNQLEAAMGNLSGKYYGVFPTAEDLPEGNNNGYAFVGANEPFAIYNFIDGEWEDSGAEAVGIQGPQGNSGYTGAVGELEVVNNLEDGGATAALSAEAGKLLARNMKLLYDSMGAAAFWGEKPVIDWSGNSVPVSLTLTNCTIDNLASTVPLGDSYEATITPDAGNILANVVCTMNGEPQTVTNGHIYIAEVTGSIVISAEGINLDSTAFDGKTYRQIFETNNVLEISPGFENGSYSPLISAGTSGGDPTISTEYADSGIYSLKVSAASAQQVKTTGVNLKSACFNACRVKVTAYVSGGIGISNVSAQSVFVQEETDWKTMVYHRTAVTSDPNAFIGSFSSPNLTGYIDTPVVVRDSIFTNAPTLAEFTALYNNYVAIKKAA